MNKTYVKEDILKGDTLQKISHGINHIKRINLMLSKTRDFTYEYGFQKLMEMTSNQNSMESADNLTICESTQHESDVRTFLCMYVCVCVVLVCVCVVCICSN